MSQLMVSKKQRDLFANLQSEGVLIFASGAPWTSVNLVGHFQVRQYKEGREDRLDVEDGTHHVHLDWSRVERCELGDFNGEGVLTFLNGDDILFRLYRPSGEFSDSVTSRTGNLM